MHVDLYSRRSFPGCLGLMADTEYGGVDSLLKSRPLLDRSMPSSAEISGLALNAGVVDAGARVKRSRDIAL